MRSEPSETEKWEWIWAQLRQHGLPKRGRPKRGSETLKWADLGVTRQTAHLWLKLGEIPEADLDASRPQNACGYALLVNIQTVLRQRQEFVVPIDVQVIFVLGLNSRQNSSAFIHLADL